MNGRTDISNAKISVQGAPEAIPAVPATTEESPAVAKPASAPKPDIINIPQTSKNSSDFS